MRDKIIEVLENNEGFVDRSRTGCCLWPDDYLIVAKEIEKLYENHIKTGTIESYDKSKFRIFTTWKETKEVSEISDEVFLGFLDENKSCNGFHMYNGFIGSFPLGCVIKCEVCSVNHTKTKADIIKWMEETG